MWYQGALILSFHYLQAARETGALQAAKNKLEKQVEELTWRLQLEKRMRVSIVMGLHLLKVCPAMKSESMNFLWALSIFFS